METHIERVELYGGDVALEFNSRTHSYWVIDGGKRFRVPSVTRICEVIDKSGPLLGWAVNAAIAVTRGAILSDTAYPEVYLEQVWQVAKGAHRALKQEAADIGTQAHRWLENDFRSRAIQAGEESVLPDTLEVRNCVEAAKGWLSEHEVIPAQVERRIYSRKHKFSGTLDKLAFVDGKLSVIDWKSSKGIYPEHRLQTAAYVGAYEEETGDRVERRWLIKLGKLDGAFEPHEFNRSDQRKDWRAFLAALKLWRRLQEIK